MKMTKSLFLAFASLGLFACSNEEVVTDNGGINGEANVVVRINTDNDSRTPSDDSEQGHLQVTGKAVVYLETATGTESQEIDLSGTGEKTASFQGVRSPGHIWVSVNKYNEAGTTPAPAISLVTANGNDNKGLSAPMFADGGNVSTNSTQWYYTDNNKTYTGTLTPEHKIARLEFSGIKHVVSTDPEANGCIFNKITFDGLFLNNIKATSDAASVTSFADWAAVSGQTPSVTMPCYDAITGGSDFLTEGDDAVSYPKAEVGECYAYNIIGGDAPTLTLCFSDIELKDGDSYWSNVGGKGYATVAKYKALGSDIKGHEDDFGASKVTDGTEGNYYEITKFPAGYIYKVTSLPIEDSNIGTTIDGKPVNVVATVTIADWKLVSGTVEWN